jgi:hypothetical protein
VFGECMVVCIERCIGGQAVRYLAVIGCLESGSGGSSVFEVHNGLQLASISARINRRDDILLFTSSHSS